MEDEQLCKLLPSMAPVTSSGEASESHSVLDAQLKVLSESGEAATLPESVKTWESKEKGSPRALVDEQIEEIIENFSLGIGEQIAVAKSKGPNSIPGTGSSIASASDYSEVSDLESDSGIENSNPDVARPKLNPVMATFKKKKGVKAGSGSGKGGSSECEGVSTPSTADYSSQSTVPVESVVTEGRIDKLIGCIEHKVSAGCQVLSGILRIFATCLFFLPFCCGH